VLLPHQILRQIPPCKLIARLPEHPERPEAPQHRRNRCRHRRPSGRPMIPLQACLVVRWVSNDRCSGQPKARRQLHAIAMVERHKIVLEVGLHARFLRSQPNGFDFSDVPETVRAGYPAFEHALGFGSSAALAVTIELARAKQRSRSGAHHRQMPIVVVGGIAVVVRKEFNELVHGVSF
jgi:hypothetical protein